MRAIYFYLMGNAPERVRDTGPRHASYWHGAALSGYEGGPFADRTGGLITFECESTGVAAKLVADDPFVIEGLIDSSWIKEWLPE